MGWIKQVLSGFFVLNFIIFFSPVSPKALVIQDLASGSAAVSDMIDTIQGNGVTITNINYTGSDFAAGVFSEGSSEDISIEEGMVLSSGNVLDALGPNIADGTGVNLGLLGDLDLDALTGLLTFDAAVLEFDLTPVQDLLYIRYRS